MGSTVLSATGQAWLEAQSGVDRTIRQRVQERVAADADGLAGHFYDRMLDDERTRGLLDHAVVNRRLHASMARWLRTLFDESISVDAALALQRHVGEVHARIGLSMDLVTRGARLIKRDLAERLAREDWRPHDLVLAIRYAYERIDSAIDAMNGAYASDAQRLVRSEEAYRLFFLNQDMKTERERQKSQLLEWAHEILVGGYGNTDDSGAAAPADAPPPAFGLWLHHKASILFEGAPELEQIRSVMAEVETGLLPELHRVRDERRDARPVVGRITQRIDRIKALLATMFDRFIEAEDGRDSVTRLLNRRHFPLVARREIALAQRQGSAFALVRLDIDAFAALREVLGHDGVDLLLAALAAALLDAVRAGDFVFRLGDEQFAVLLVETSADALPAVADALRRRVEALRLRTAAGMAAAVTVSVGVALYDGHPDYQRLLERAERALATAVAAGPNRVVLAD